MFSRPLLTSIDQYAYEQPYLTPFPSSSVESQQWNQYARASFPDINMSTFPIDQTTNLFQQPIPITPGRPRSSPSTFGPSPENLSWAPSAGLGIQYPAAQPTPLIPTAAFPPTPYQPDPATTTASSNHFPTSPPPTLQQPRPTRPQAPTPYQPIAPAPTTTGTKRRADSLDPPTTTNTTTSPTPRTSSTSTSKRRRTASVEGLSESSKTLLRLKEDEDLPWKDIAQQMGSASVPALQMQWRRLRDRRREWGEEDVRALRQACEWWERGRWEIVSAKVSFAQRFTGDLDFLRDSG